METKVCVPHTLGIRLLLRLPADSLLPGQTPAQEASCGTLWNTLMSMPSSAMMTAANVESTPGISCSSATWVHRAPASAGCVVRESPSAFPLHRVGPVATAKGSDGALPTFLPGPTAVAESYCAVCLWPVQPFPPSSPSLPTKAFSIRRPETPKTSVAALDNLMLALSSNLSKRLRSAAWLSTTLRR